MKTLKIYLLLAALPLLFPAWGQARTYTIGFSQSDTAESDWRRANTASVREAARQLKIDLVFKEAAGDTALQRRQVQELIDRKVDAIVLAANEVHGWDQVLLRAKKARIPVVLCDRTITLAPENRKKGLYVAWVGSDFRYEGRAAAAWLAQETAGSCNIVEIQGPPEAAPSIERGKGFREVAALFPGLRIIDSQTGMWRTETGREVMRKFLKDEGRNICAVFAQNDNMAFGAVEAIEEMGLKPGKDILVIGVDAVRHGFELLIQRKVNALVECNPLLGKIVLKTTTEILNGRPVPKVTYIKDRVFTVHNAKAALPSRQY